MHTSFAHAQGTVGSLYYFSLLFLFNKKFGGLEEVKMDQLRY